MKRFVAMAILGGLMVCAAPGQTIRRQDKRQDRRIAEGARSGDLTRRDAQRLDRKEDRLEREIRRDRIDGGGLTVQERRKIDRKQDNLSRKIYREKHDRQQR